MRLITFLFFFGMGQILVANNLESDEIRSDANLFSVSGEKETNNGTDLPQPVTVKGKVISKTDNLGLPGVSVVVKGTTVGVATGMEGDFTIEVPNPNSVLLFSFIGYKPQEIAVNGRTQINVTLEEDIESLDEVVVTALNIERDKESLGYSITQVGADEVTQAKENNVMNSLAGKVAGLQISTNPSGVDGSTRVVLRGISSLTGSNRPLFVVDGVPIQGGSYGGGNNIDRGDALSDINPEDIASISVLKGAGAAAAYGSRGGNGVVLITTKKGKAREGIGISVNSSFSIQQPYLFPDLQNEYGQGAFGTYPIDISSAKGAHGWAWSWGPKMEGQTITNHLGEEDTLDPTTNPFKEYYENGSSLTNTIAFSGGSADANFRASITNQDSEGMIPNNRLSKQTINLRGFSKLGRVVELDGKVTYIHHKARNRPYIAEDNASAGFAFNTMPRNISTDILKNHTTDEEGRQIWHWDDTAGNPYWNLENKRNWDERNRFQTYLSLKFIITNNISLLTRSGFDFTNRIENSYGARGSRNINNFRGEYKNRWSNAIEWNTDYLLSYKNSIANAFDFGLNLGGNYRYSQNKSIDQGGDDWNVPDFYHIKNLKNQNTGAGFDEKEVWSSYLLGNISWKNYLHFDFSYRVDVSSTIPIIDNANVYGYHSENLSILLSELLDLQSGLISTWKLRGSYAKVGNDTDPYKTNNYFSLGSDDLNQLYPYGTIENNLAFFDLKPELTYSWEVGTNLGLWNNRLEIDATYYTAKTENQLMSVQLAPSTGYDNREFNAGEVKNSGVELQVTGTPVLNPNGLQWEFILNWTRNNSEVIRLADDKPFLRLRGVPLDYIFVEARPGEAYGQIYGYDYARDDQGRIQVDSKGYPLPSDDLVSLGDINPDFMAGLTNKLSYKNISLRVLVDGQMGGEYYSHSSLYRDLFGTGANSLEGRDEWYATHGGAQFLEELKGVYPEGYYQEGVFEGTDIPNDIAIDPFDRISKLLGTGVGEEQKKIPTDYIMDATNVRLREVVLAYQLPRKWFENSFIQRANVSIVGRNLLFIYNATKDIDPESGINHQNVGPSIEWNTMPGSRTYGFNINIDF